MEIEKLKKKLILEAHNHFVAVAKARPYVEFGNFVESLRRDDNKALIESIQKGVIAIIEGTFQNENDPGRALLKKADKITQDELNKLINDGNTQQLMGLLYPFIIQSIDQANFTNPHLAEKVFANSIDTLPEKIKELEPMVSGTPGAFLYNYANKFITSAHIKNAKVPTKGIKGMNNVTKDEDVEQEEGNLSQYWEYRDESKRKGAKEYGKAIDFKNVEHEGNLVPMVNIKWKGLKNRAGNYTVKPTTEWIPREEMQAYNLRDLELYNVDSLSSPVGEGTLEDTIASDKSNISENDTTTDILNIMKNLIDEFNFGSDDENVKKALNEYFARTTADPKVAEDARVAIFRIKDYLAKGTFPMVSGTQTVNPDYDTTEKLEKALASLEIIRANNEPPKIATLANRHGISVKKLQNAFDKIKDAALDKQELWDSREEVLDEA